MIRPKVRAELITWFEEHPSEVGTANRIAKDTGLQIHQIQQGVYNLRNAHEWWKTSIETVTRGRAWRFTPASVLTENAHVEGVMKFELLRRSKHGFLVLEDDDGILWKATKLT